MRGLQGFNVISGREKAFNRFMLAYLVICIICWKICIGTIVTIDVVDSFRLSEFLINFQGGYVRRGLVGELLFVLSSHTGLDPRWAILAVCGLSCGVVVAVLFYLFKKNEVRWWLLPLSYTLAGADFIRKDFLGFVVIIGMLYVLKSTKLADYLKIPLYYVLMLLLMHIHEAFFFVIVPFSIYYMVCVVLKRHNVLAKCTFAFLGVLPFLVISEFHGTPEVAQAIQASWHELLPNRLAETLPESAFSPGGKGQNSISAIGWDALETMKFHFRINFDKFCKVYGFFFWPLVLFAVYYLVTRYMYLFTGKRTPWLKTDPSAFSTLMVFQFVSLFPMFTVLSCDFGRVFMYWTTSTLLIWLIMGFDTVQGLFPKKCMEVVRRWDAEVNSLLPPTKLKLCFIILFVGLAQYGYDIGACFAESVYGNFFRCVSSMLSMINKMLPSL